jgi:biotin carboxyl carrier protein
MKFTVHINNETFEVEISKQSHEAAPSIVKINGEETNVQIGADWDRQFPHELIIGDVPYEVEFEYGEDGFPKRMWLNGSPANVNLEFLGKDKLSKGRQQAFLTPVKGHVIQSPMPGKIVKILVKDNQLVYEGNLCVVLEAMKMENELESPQTGFVEKIYVKEGDLVEIDQVLISFVEQDDLFF